MSVKDLCSTCRLQEYCSKKCGDMTDGIVTHCWSHEPDKNGLNLAHRSDESYGQRLRGVLEYPY